VKHLRKKGLYAKINGDGERRDGAAWAQNPSANPALPDYDSNMLRWAAIFLIIAIIAALLGFVGIAGAAANIAKALFYLFGTLFLILLLIGLFVGRKLF
jgi:uncharacterized membrane protein YtjA (UPF0391 family)